MKRAFTCAPFQYLSLYSFPQMDYFLWSPIFVSPPKGAAASLDCLLVFFFFCVSSAMETEQKYVCGCAPTSTLFYYLESIEFQTHNYNSKLVVHEYKQNQMI